MKKIIFCISLLILFSVLFSTQLIGFGVKRMVKAKTDCELAYRSCQWEQGHLVFSDVVLFDPSLQVHMEKVSFRLDVSSFPKKLKGHLTIDAPHIAMIKNRAIPQLGAGWFDLSVSVHNGRMFWGGPVHFALGHNAEQSQLSMHWDNGSVQLTCAKEKVDAVLDRFQVALLKAWIPHIDVREGTVSGRMALDREGNLLSGHLKLTDASLAFSNCNADGVQGAFSYNQGLGAKWDCQGIGKANGELFPFFSTGRAFFKTFWMESDMRFDESHCKISGDDKRVSLECHAVTASEASWMQAAACFLLPECAAIAMTHGILSGKASWSGDTWSAQFTADQLTLTHGDISLSCQSLIADLRQEGGSFILSDKDYELKLAGMWDDWNAEARIHQAELLLNGGWDGDKVVFEIEKGKMAELQFQGKGDIDSHFNVSLLVDGTWTFLQQNIPFYGPIHCQEGKIWDVDVRGKRKTWDFCRFHFTYDGTEILYLPSSHFLGKALTAHPCALNEIDLSVQLPWNNLLAAGPLLTLWNMDIKTLPDIGNTELHFQYKQGQIDLTAQGDLPFSFHAHHALDEWAFEWTSDLILSARLKEDGTMKGFGKWKSAFEAAFEGKVDPSFHCAFSLANIKLDFSGLPVPPELESLQLQGNAAGAGHFIYNGQMEADLDFGLSNLVVMQHPLENEGGVRFSYHSARGALLQGLHLHGDFDCIIGLLEYDIHRKRCLLHNAQVHIPVSLIPYQFNQFLDQDRDLNFTSDFDFAFDFSTLCCTMHEGTIPMFGALHHIEQLNVFWKGSKCLASFYDQGHLFRLDLQMDEQMKGRLFIGDEELPLAIDWEYKDQLYIQSIEGSFSGLEASFHAESPNRLVGSARLNLTALGPVLPRDVAHVFEELKMGQGYELKGRLKIENHLPLFQGILSGKAIELFGFQFRTLLAGVDLGPKKVHIYDIKISDSAGVMKMDEILIQDQNPWTIRIPNLTILDLRPCLLVRPGGTAGPLDPLVVRELKLTDFKGNLEDGKTYTAKGKLHFINSYKRGETVFDVPANVLSRIVGLDLELLIPVTGDLTFDVKDGYFNLLELTHAYSEGKRSQFFLETNPPPRMDLDGNLQIFIKMKQFVLLKITESLLISIDGALDHPQYHLKRRRFFGLM